VIHPIYLRHPLHAVVPFPLQWLQSEGQASSGGWTHHLLVAIVKCHRCHCKSHKYNRSESIKMMIFRDFIALTSEWNNKLFGRGSKLARLSHACILGSNKQFGWASVPIRHTHTGARVYTLQAKTHPSNHTHQYAKKHPALTQTGAVPAASFTHQCSHTPSHTGSRSSCCHHGHTGLQALVPLQDLHSKGLLQPKAFYDSMILWFYDYNSMTGQTVLTMCRAQLTSLQADSLFRLIFLFSQTWSFRKNQDPSLSPPLLPPLNIL